MVGKSYELLFSDCVKSAEARFGRDDTIGIALAASAKRYLVQIPVSIVFHPDGKLLYTLLLSGNLNLVLL